MDLGELYRKALTLTYTAEFGSEEAARLAAMLPADRQVWIKRWYDAMPITRVHSVPQPTHPYLTEKHHLTVLLDQIERIRAQIECDGASPLLQGLEDERAIVEARMEEARVSYMHPDYVRAQLLRQIDLASRIIAESPEGFRRALFTFRRLAAGPGPERLRSLKEVAVRVITPKNRVMLTLEDLKNRLSDAAESDRESLTPRVTAVTDRYALQVALIESLKELLHAEEEAVRTSREPDPHLWNTFEGEVEAFAQQVALPA